MKHKIRTASTLLHLLVLSIELGTVQIGTGKVDPARKFKCTTAARERYIAQKMEILIQQDECYNV